MTGVNALIEASVIIKFLDNFYWYLMVFITLKLIVFYKIYEFINFAVPFCLKVTESNNGLVHIFSSEIKTYFI